MICDYSFRRLHQQTNNMPVIDTSTNYGTYTPAPIIRRLIRLAQHCPDNWPGNQLALIIRKLVRKTAAMPLDSQAGDIQMRFYLHDNVSERKFLFMPQRFDPAERELIQQLLPADGTFIDIGANVGIYTLTAARVLNHQGRILAFEPNPPAFARLQFNINANPGISARITLLQEGVSDQDAEFELQLDASNLGGSSLKSRAAAASTQHVSVRCRPLLQVLMEQNITRMDMLKIDIEGAEDIALAPFLQQADDSLLPDYIIIERSERDWQIDLHALLQQRGYRQRLETRMNRIFQRPKT
ncbi:MAG: FkbM family methyltransferase [Gammaproteobacteria bacterium]